MKRSETLARREVIDFECGVTAVQISRGRYTLIDTADKPTVLPFMWSYDPRPHAGYVVRRARGGRQLMLHRALLGDESRSIDHVNHDGLDNRRENLRGCTQSQNQYNCRLRSRRYSKYHGVTFDKSRSRGAWIARIKVAGTQHTVGRFDNELDAAMARDAAARRMHGEFATLNFVEAWEQDFGEDDE